MSDDSLRPIIVKKIKKGGHGHHGGAWKIAYADFVTAMMAFFLLMWLLGSTTKATLKGISEYFSTPLKVALLGGEGAGDATSIIKGGGEDLTRSTGQVKAGADQDETQLSPDRTWEPTNSENISEQELEKAELNQLAEMKEKLEQIFDNNPKIEPYRDQLKIDMTPEGLRIQILDEKNRPMFDSGKAVLQPYTKDILTAISEVLNEVPNRIGLSGHTDASPYAGGQGSYSNWELSVDRANATRREMVKAGLNESKVLRVVGLADAVPLVTEDPLAPQNRRISIIVLNKKTEVSLIQSSGQDGAIDKVDVPQSSDKASISKEISAAQAKPLHPEEHEPPPESLYKHSLRIKLPAKTEPQANNH